MNLNNLVDLKLALSDLSAVLIKLNCKFHLTGGLATSFYGEPRFTQDIDIVIKIENGKFLDMLILELAKKFIIDDLHIKNEVARNGLFQVLHEETIIKIDFHVGEAIEGELERSINQEILSGITLPLVSKEDAILSKLLWIKQGSHKSRHDAKTILIRNSTTDIDYLHKKAKELQTEYLLKEILKELKK